MEGGEEREGVGGVALDAGYWDGRRVSSFVRFLWEEGVRTVVDCAMTGTA